MLMPYAPPPIPLLATITAPALLPRQTDDPRRNPSFLGFITTGSSYTAEYCPLSSFLYTSGTLAECCDIASSADCSRFIFTACDVSRKTVFAEAFNNTCQNTCGVDAIYPSDRPEEGNPVLRVGCERNNYFYFREAPTWLLGSLTTTKSQTVRSTLTPLSSRFTVSTSQSTDPTPEARTVTVQPSQATTFSVAESQNGNASTSPIRLSASTKAGIGVGVVVAIILILLGVLWVLRSKKRKAKMNTISFTDQSPAEDNTFKNYERKELDGTVIAEAPFAVVEVPVMKDTPAELHAESAPGELESSVRNEPNNM